MARTPPRHEPCNIRLGRRANDADVHTVPAAMEPVASLPVRTHVPRPVLRPALLGAGRGGDHAVYDAAAWPRPWRGPPRPRLVAAADAARRRCGAVSAPVRVGGPGRDPRALRAYARVTGLGLFSSP